MKRTIGNTTVCGNTITIIGVGWRQDRIGEKKYYVDVQITISCTVVANDLEYTAETTSEITNIPCDEDEYEAHSREMLGESSEDKYAK